VPLRREKALFHDLLFVPFHVSRRGSAASTAIVKRETSNVKRFWGERTVRLFQPSTTAAAAGAGRGAAGSLRGSGAEADGGARRECREHLLQLPAMAAGAFRLVGADHQSLKGASAILTNIFKNRHRFP